MAKNTDEDWILSALGKLLSPIVRFALKRSISYQDFVAVLKRTFVAIGAEELEKDNDEVTASKISAFTGLNRPDAKRIYVDQEPIEYSTLNIPARVAAQWGDDKRFCRANGKPRVLSVSGDDNEFKELVESVNKAYGVKTILDEMMRLGLVERTGKSIKLIDADVVVQSDEPSVELLAKDIDSLCRAVDENMSSEEKSNLHIRTSYDNIFLSDLPELKWWLVTEGRKFHQKVREKLSKHDRDTAPDRDPKEPGGGKICVTAFSNWTDGEGEP